MITSNFIVRKSGVGANKYYIDYNGIHSIKKLADMMEVKIVKIDEICKRESIAYSEEFDLYYYESKEKANNRIVELQKIVKPSKNKRMIELTEQEIEYIRKALINEDSNALFTKPKIKEAIFNKLNS